MRALLRRAAWLYSWGEARRHRSRAVVAIVAQAWVGVALLAYFRLTDRNGVAAVILGAAAGGALGLWVFRRIQQPERRRRSSLPFVFEGAVAAIGIALAVAAILASDAGLFLAALPFLGLSLVLTGLKKLSRK